MRCWNALVLVAALAAAGTGPARAETPVERGRYLVTAIAACGNCHTPHDAANRELPGMELAGGREFDDAELGHIVGPNITPDRETGIGAWSAAQIVTALRTGRRPDGTLIAPPMPIEFYRGLGDRDAEAIAAYVKSLKPVHHAVARSHYRVPLPPSYGPEVAHVAEPDRGDKVAYGAYLAGPVAHCMECHTPRIRGVLQRDRLGAGGRELPDIGHPGALTVSRNITPDPEHGLGKWSDADIERAITLGLRPDGTRLAETMPFAAYRRMTAADLAAIVAYLRLLPPQQGP
jgi:mono/diheme cytochrome c family protein